MSKVEELEAAWREAETRAQQIMAEKDQKLAEIKATYGDQQRTANQEAADAQKAFLDAQAANTLLDRPGGEAIAASLGLELPTEE